MLSRVIPSSQIGLRVLDTLHHQDCYTRLSTDQAQSVEKFGNMTQVIYKKKLKER